MNPRADQSGSDPLDTVAAEFLALRPKLFGIAYRMLGSAAEAEDIVQEAWLRWQSADRSVVRDKTAFLATTTTRLAINALQSARGRRETYIGPWLPEPVDTSHDPELGAERGEALRIAVLMLLEKLAPAERAAYVLREAFAYEYGQIAEILESNEPNVRQIVSRARKHMAGERRAPVAPQEHRRLLEAFLVAAQAGDAQELEKLFSESIVSYADGGGMPGAARVPIEGRERVAKVISGFAARVWPGVSIDRIEANGQDCLLIRRDGEPYALLTIEASEAGIERVLWVLNPEKLARISSQGLSQGGA